MEHMLTTTDNPFHPFTQPNEWQAWDESHGYHTLALQARLLVTSDELSEADRSEALEQAIDIVVDLNLSGVHTKVPITRQ